MVVAAMLVPAMSKMDQRISGGTNMPPRGKAPGLKRGRVLKDGTALWYWMAKQVVRNPMGFPDLSIPLPRGADHETLAELCHEHTAPLLAWIDETQAAEPRMATIRYDGSMESLFGAYQQHPESSFQEVRHNTRRTYESTARFIVADVGARLVRNVTGLDVK